MKKGKQNSAKTALTCSTRRRLLWILIVLAVVPALMAVAFRPLPLSPRLKGEAGLPMTEVAEAAAFGPTVRNAETGAGAPW